MNPIDMRDQSIAKVMRTVRTHYSEDDLNVLREKFTQFALKIEDEADAFRTARTEYKLRVAPLEVEKRKHARSLRDRFRDDDVECYLVPNHEAGMMEFFSVATGEKVDERRLRPDERQLRFQTI